MSKIPIIELSDKEITTRLKENTLKMLSNRVDSNMEALLDTDIIKTKEDGVYEFNEENKIYLKIFCQKISSVKKSPAVSIFLSDYKKFHKILIFKDIPKKAVQQILAMGKVEVFLEKEMMVDILASHYQPKFELLSNDQKKECMKSYNVEKNQFIRISKTDPVTRYYNLKGGDVIRVIIPCETSGQKIEYAIVA